MRATHQMECTDEEKIATLFNVAGREAVGLTAEEQKDYTKVLSALKKYCESLHEYNETYERFIFSRRAQQEGETFENFYQAIQELVVSCNYPDQSKQLRDRIVQGIRDKALQESLLRIKNLTEDVAAQQARTTEISRTQVMNMAKCGIGAESSNTIVVDSMKNRRSRKGKNNQRSNNVSNPNPNSNPNSNPNPKKNNPPTSGEPPKGKFRCIKCDTFHGKRLCPAFGQTCGKCNKPYHLTKCCLMEIKQVAELRTHEHDVDVVVLHSLQCLDTKNEWRELIKIGNRHVVMKLDPGAHCNTQPSATPEYSYNGSQKEVLRRGGVLELQGVGQKVWVQASGNADLLGLTALQIHQNFQLCSDHFEPQMFWDKFCTKLRPKFAVLTIFSRPPLLDEQMLQYGVKGVHFFGDVQVSMEGVSMEVDELAVHSLPPPPLAVHEEPLGPGNESPEEIDDVETPLKQSQLDVPLPSTPRRPLKSLERDGSRRM
ncbi:Serine/threonine-protein kinase D1044.8 [Frankliniella fusca]|uniref:Serine/threonine-protein kinase D1044.8 n=1 Tax=Frankliniella fusca TaxID=407009 RepID=A0AAE1LN27_9NEOP|nr:Serine/threonine-protein kinase D1044.8 [Frankliniella fusca]